MMRALRRRGGGAFPDFIPDLQEVETVGVASIQVPDRRAGYLDYLSQGYWRIFGQAWPAWLGGLLLGVTNFALFAYAAPWSIYGGFNLAGGWVISFFGMTPTVKLVSPWLSTAFVLDVALILGSFISCLLASSFRLRLPRRKIRLLDGFVGGLFMGVGATLSPACNIGGIFSAMSSLSLSGFVMLLSVVAGAYGGVVLARWRLQRDFRTGGAAMYESLGSGTISDAPRSRWRQPVIGVLVLAASLLLVEMSLGNPGGQTGVYMLFGLAFGFFMQRSGFCFTAAFRDPFTSGDGRLARGAIVAIAVATLGFAVLVGAGLRKPVLLPVGWHTLVGGVLFGFGMVLAGGCASGTLFRIGEGSVQLLFALFGGMLSAPLFSVFWASTKIPSGPRLWLVDLLGWQGALFASIAFLSAWLLLVQWNERHRRRVR